MQAVALTVILLTGLGQCDDCQTQHAGYGHGGGCLASWGVGDGLALAPMPQTCYQPRYGCYYSNNRHMNRYPAFHGYYYRRPYNYRNLFDYPWHAELHEPSSLFTYQVPEEELLDLPVDALDTPDPGAGYDVPPVPAAPKQATEDKLSNRREPARFVPISRSK